MLAGAVAAGSFVAGLFFFRFWRHTRDAFFVYFALAFWLEGANRVALAAIPHADESEPLFYMVRLLAYGLIIVAIWRKNRQRGG
nr:DUF5985 family protein [Ramlibacter pallidus]